MVSVTGSEKPLPGVVWHVPSNPEPASQPQEERRTETFVTRALAFLRLSASPNSSTEQHSNPKLAMSLYGLPWLLTTILSYSAALAAGRTGANNAATPAGAGITAWLR